MLTQLAIGAGIAGLTIFLFELISPRNRSLYANTLFLVASVYLGFTFLDPTIYWLAVEIIGLLIYLVLAIAGRSSSWLLVVGWLAHPVWDALHGSQVVPFAFTSTTVQGAFRLVPIWYPPLCTGFDCTIAIFLALRLLLPHWRR